MEAHENGSITIKDNVCIGQNCHITSEGSEILIGKGSAVMADVCITNIDHNYKQLNIPVLEQGYTTKETSIGENCFIGQGAYGPCDCRCEFCSVSRGYPFSW